MAAKTVLLTPFAQLDFEIATNALFPNESLI